MMIRYNCPLLLLLLCSVHPLRLCSDAGDMPQDTEQEGRYFYCKLNDELLNEGDFLEFIEVSQRPENLALDQLLLVSASPGAY